MARIYSVDGTAALKPQIDCGINDNKVVCLNRTKRVQDSSRCALLTSLLDDPCAYEPYDLESVSPKTAKDKILCVLAVAVPVVAMFIAILAPAFA